MKYISHGKEVTKEEFESLVGEQFKWFQNDTVNAIDFSSVSTLFDGDFKSQRQINDHIKGVLDNDYLTQKLISLESFAKEKYLEKDDVINSSNRGEKEMMGHFNKIKACSPQCYCDGSCKKEIKEPFSVQVPKPTTLNQSQFFDYPTPEKTLEQFKEALRKLKDKNKEGIKESQSVKKAPIFTYCKVNSLALEALAFRALYGHEKYNKNGEDADFQNFTRVPNAEEEYSNSMFRHALNIGEEETEEGHLIASAWNAVSRLEIFLRNK